MIDLKGKNPKTRLIRRLQQLIKERYESKPRHNDEAKGKGTHLRGVDPSVVKYSVLFREREQVLFWNDPQPSGLRNSLDNKRSKR